jgi:hypothetical protein
MFDCFFFYPVYPVHPVSVLLRFTDMHTPRITNASLFVTVLSACLGLLMTGVPTAHAQTQQGIRTAVSKSQALAAASATYQQSSPQQARKLAAAAGSYFRFDAACADSQPAQLLYQNSRALTDKDQLLVVTRLPRAGLVSGC